MRFLLDVNVGSTIARALQAAGHDVFRAALSNSSALDEDLMALAAENDRVLVTCDRDLGELVFAKGVPAPPAIIYIRFEPEDVAEVLPRLLPLLDFEQLRNHITVIDPRQTRRTPFPVRRNDNG